jgi:hypothetical protein
VVRVATLALLPLILCCEARPESGPQPPCGTEPFPLFSAVGDSPIVKVWDRLDWTPPACTGWASTGPSTLVAVAGRFRHSSGVEGLRRRVGAISSLTGLLYWSTTNQRWQPLIVDAYALSESAAGQHRQDFSLDEIVAGRGLFVHQEDNLFGQATYSMQIVSVSKDRLVFATANVSPIQYLGVPLVPPGEIQSICFVERESSAAWRYYSLTRTGKLASLLMSGHDASLINRAVALYRHLAGIPPDTEPPASR